MIYRRWSLLTGTAVATCVVAGTVIVGNLLFVQENPFVTPVPKKQGESSSK